jgi:hypothetical protein
MLEWYLLSINTTGYSIMEDNDHYFKAYSENWASSVDFLTEFWDFIK